MRIVITVNSKDRNFTKMLRKIVIELLYNKSQEGLKINEYTVMI